MDLKGYYYVTYSPDDEAECGKGWYAHVYPRSTEVDGVKEYGDCGPLCASDREAEAWARKHGGRKRVDA